MYKSNVISRSYHRTNPRVYQSFEAAGYMLNQFGNIASDFSLLSQQNDLQTMQRVLSRLQELPDEERVGKSVRQMCAELRSRYCQTPAELDRFEQYCIDNALDFYMSQQAQVSESGATMPIDESPSSPVSSKVS